MLKKTIRYTDYNGAKQEEDHYFNLSVTELMEVKTMLDKLISSTDALVIAQTIEAIILKAYGEKSLDGKRFVKSKELSEAFAQTAAFEQLFTELTMDTGAAAAFVNGIVPADLSESTLRLAPMPMV